MRDDPFVIGFLGLNGDLKSSEVLSGSSHQKNFLLFVLKAFRYAVDLNPSSFLRQVEDNASPFTPRYGGAIDRQVFIGSVPLRII